MQDVAVKMLAQADTSQLQLFKRVRHLATACPCCCQTPAWAAMPPEGSSWAVWHFHIWHAHPCSSLLLWALPKHCTVYQCQNTLSGPSAWVSAEC